MTVSGLPPRDIQVEPYLTTQELADLMGVSVPTIKRFRREGMPAETWGLRAVRFQASRCIAWARARG